MIAKIFVRIEQIIYMKGITFGILGLDTVIGSYGAVVAAHAAQENMISLTSAASVSTAIIFPLELRVKQVLPESP